MSVSWNLELLTGGALGLALYGVRGGTSGVLSVFKSDEDRLQEGLEHLNQGEFSKALKIFNKIVSKNPQNSIAYFIRGQAFALTSDVDRSIEDYSYAIKLDPKFIDAYSARGSLLCEKQRYDQALADFSTSIILNDQSFAIFLARAKVYVALGEYVNAINDYDAVISLEPSCSEAYFLALQEFRWCPLDIAFRCSQVAQGPWYRALAVEKFGSHQRCHSTAA